jgi:hypothetical protein
MRRRNIKVQTTVVTFQQIADPVRVPLVVAVTVWTVVHNLPIEDTATLVNLPEDDAVVTRTAQPVALHRTLHLFLGKIATADHRPTERALRR